METSGMKWSGLPAGTERRHRARTDKPRASWEIFSTSLPQSLETEESPAQRKMGLTINCKPWICHLCVSCACSSIVVLLLLPPFIALNILLCLLAWTQTTRHLLGTSATKTEPLKTSTPCIHHPLASDSPTRSGALYFTLRVTFHQPISLSASFAFNGNSLQRNNRLHIDFFSGFSFYVFLLQGMKCPKVRLI